MGINGFILFILSAFLLLFGISYFVVNEILKLLNAKKTSKKSLYYSLLIVPFLFLLQFLNVLLEIKFINELFFILIVILLYSLPIILFVKIIGKILKLNSKRQITLICLLLIAFLGIGIYTAQTYEIKNIEITSDKISKEYKLVLISDVHIGSESPDYLAKIVDEIIKLNPDMVFITGDLVDSSRISIQDLDSLNNFSMPVFFIFGNHEHYANKDESFFNEIKGLNILNNEIEEFEELEIIGLNYYLEDYGHIDIAETLETLNINKSKFTILLNHEPSQVDSVADSNIDLMLTGHLHGGQLYPFNYLVKSIIGYIYGMYSIENTSLYVTSGVGTWGPNMRLGTKNEIVQIKLSPSDTKEEQKDNSNIPQINQSGVSSINQEKEGP